MTSQDKPDHDRVEETLNTVDPAKRETLRRMVGVAFVAPLVASFPIDGMTIGPAAAQSNMTIS